MLIAAELEAGAELTVRYALQGSAHWHFSGAELRSSTQAQTLASYPNTGEAARQLGSELRPALSRLTAVLDRLRLQFVTAATAEAVLRRLGRNYVVRSYAVRDGSGIVVCQWQNQALAAPAPRAPTSSVLAR